MTFFGRRHSGLDGEDIGTIIWREVADSAARVAMVVTEAHEGRVVKQLDNSSLWVLDDYTGPSWVEITAVGVAAVTSVFGQIGDVSEADASFTAADIANVAAGTIAATDVQAAIDELATGKAPATHTHVLSQIQDSGTAAAKDIGTTIGDVVGVVDIGGAIAGLPAIDGSQLTGIEATGSAIELVDDTAGGGVSLTVDLKKLTLKGAGWSVAEPVADEIDITVAPGAAPVDSWGPIGSPRTGVISPIASDYDASQVDNDSAVTGAFVDDALNTLDTDKAETTDARFPTTDEKGALAGTGTPSGSNRYVVDDDSRMADIATALSTANAALPQLGTSTNNAIVRYDGLTGDQQDSEVTIGDGGSATMTWPAGTTSINSSIVESSTIQSYNALRTWADHVQYEAADTVVPDVSVRGIWWVKDDNPTTPHFKQGDGTDHNLLTPEGANILATGVTDTTLALKPDGTGGAEWVAESGGGGGSALTVEDDGTPLTTNATKLNFAGAVVVTEPVADEITVTVTPGSAPVASVFGDVGEVVAAASHYDASQIDNDATNANGNVTGAYVANALDTADAAIEANTTAATAAQADADAAQSDATSAKTKTDFLTVTQTINLDTVESDTADNNAKISYTDAATVAAHGATLANVATPITTAGAALLDDLSNGAQRTSLGLGSAAVENVGTTIGDVAQYVNVGGSAGLPAVNGSQLTNLPIGTDITVFDEAVELTTALNKLTFTGTGVEATEPGAEGEITVNITSGGVGVIDITDGTTNVTAADLLTFNATAFDVVDQGANDALLNPVFGTNAGQLAEGDHVHTTLSGVDSLTSGVILGRDTAGVGLSEELTPAEARGVINVTIDNIGVGTHSSLENAVADAGTIFASLQTGQVEGLTDVAAATGQKIPIELTGAGGAWRRVDMDDVLPNTANVEAAGALMDSEVDADIKTLALPANTTISPFGATLVDDVDEATARTTLGVAPITGAGGPGASTAVDRIEGTIYIDTTADLAYTLVDATNGSNVWSAGGGAGTTILTGAVDPTTEGIDGDFYYNTVKRGYWYKDTGTWEAVGILADDVTTEVDATNGLQLKGFPAASTNTSPRKTAGGAIEWVTLGGSEVNDLTTMSGIVDDQIAVGNGAGTGAYKTLPNGAVSYAIATNTFTQATLTDLSDVSGFTGADNVVRATGPTIVTPFIASMTNAQHDHSDAAGGGNIAFSALTGELEATDFADNTVAPARLTTQADSGALIFNASGVPAYLGPGTAGQVLQSGGTGVIPSWATAGGDVSATGTPLITQYARWTDGNTIEGRTLLETQTDLGVRVGTDVQEWSAVLDATTASFTTDDETKLDAIEALADVTDAVNVAAAGAPIISSGAGAPGSTPSAVGDVYVDTTADVSYIAAGTASSADWKQATGTAGADLDGLSDVTLTTPDTDAVLIKTAGNWVDGTINTDSITADAVTNAKLDPMAANTVKANATAGAANPTNFAVGASTVLGRGAAGNIVAAQLETSQIADDAVTLAKIDAHTGEVAGALVYGVSGVPSEANAGSTVGHVLKSAGTAAAPVFGQIITDSITTASVTNAKLDDMLANTVKVRAAGTTGVPSDLAVGANEVLGRAAGNIVSGKVITDQITDDHVTYAKVQNVVNNSRVLGRISGAGGVVEELTGANILTISGADAAGTARPADEIETSGTNVTISATAPGGAGEALVTTSGTAAAWKARQKQYMRFTIEDPVAGDNFIDLGVVDVACTIQKVYHYFRGAGTSIAWQMAHGTNPTSGANLFSSSVTTNTKTSIGSTSTGFNDASLAAGETMWLDAGTLTGAVDLLHLTVVYTED